MIVIENVIRTSILFFMYAIFETHANLTQTDSLGVFFGDTSHQFIGLTALFLGLSLGLANLTADRHFGLLKETSAQLKKYSEWLLGRDLLIQAFVSPSALSLTRRERAVMFMDVRGFTRWSETQSPENVVNLLTEFYQVTETILTRHGTIKYKLSADEVMAIFPTADSAIHAALELRRQVNQLLSSEHLGVGIGLHHGLVIEGLLGSAGVRFYDVIGDTVNTAKRIESAAQSGEVLLSENVYQVIGQAVGAATKREISVKGKENPVAVYSLEDRNAG
ncbi:MAG: adenylate/guanylate cyclase domain-containing protein [Ardenticatenaceae bacterium]|nr:adenylate/guanylate cyclase domain-containing protein [Ardenticatenaceae bacterium]